MTVRQTEAIPSLQEGGGEEFTYWYIAAFVFVVIASDFARDAFCAELFHFGRVENEEKIESKSSQGNLETEARILSVVN